MVLFFLLFVNKLFLLRGHQENSLVHLHSFRNLSVSLEELLHSHTIHASALEHCPSADT